MSFDPSPQIAYAVWRAYLAELPLRDVNVLELRLDGHSVEMIATMLELDEKRVAEVVEAAATRFNGSD